MQILSKQYFREPVNALTHLAGVGFSVIAFVLLINRGLEAESIAMLAAFSVFGVSLILLYSSSTLYHSIRASAKTIQKFRKLDHMMIYVLIAGTFTPFCILVIDGLLGNIMLVLMWSIALVGVIMKMFMKSTAGWISIAMYIVMGWTGIILIPFMMDALPAIGVIWLATGGIIYTIGAVIYGTHRPDPLPNRFGYHEIWHLFVLGGSFAHFWTVYRYVGMGL